MSRDVLPYLRVRRLAISRRCEWHPGKAEEFGRLNRGDGRVNLIRLN